MQRFEGRNTGAIKALKLVEADLASVPHGSEINFSDIRLSIGSSWTDIYFTVETAGFSDSAKSERAGIFYEKRVVFSIPSLRREISVLLEGFSGMRLLALVTDMNERSWLVHPVRLLAVMTIPEAFSGYNGYICELTGKNTHPSPLVVMPG